MSSLADVSFTKEFEREMEIFPLSLRLIQEDIWCGHTEGIIIFDLALNEIRDISFEEKMGIYRVDDMDDHIVAASEQGLFLLSYAGAVATFIVFQIYRCK